MDMKNILQNMDAAASGQKPSAGAKNVNDMKTILESISKVKECGMEEMPMQSPMSAEGQPVTVSVTASGKDNVADLIALMQQAAGIEQHVDMPMAHDTHIDTDSHNVSGQEMDMATMRQIMAAGEEESPKEDDVDEEWDNAPDEEYKDDDYMIKDLSGGLNRQKKAYAASVRGDNAMAVESIKSRLLAALEEKKAKN